MLKADSNHYAIYLRVAQLKILKNTSSFIFHTHSDSANLTYHFWESYFTLIAHAGLVAGISHRPADLYGISHLFRVDGYVPEVPGVSGHDEAVHALPLPQRGHQGLQHLARRDARGVVQVCMSARLELEKGGLDAFTNYLPVSSIILCIFSVMLTWM